MTKRLELSGKRFGRLTVLGTVAYINRGRTVWQCRCSCGNTINVIGFSLTSGNTRSCGCLRRESAVEQGRRLGVRHWQQRCAGRPYPPAAVPYAYDATLSPAQARGLARELARVLLVEGCGDPDYGTAFNLARRAMLYPHLAPALPAEMRQVAA